MRTLPPALKDHWDGLISGEAVTAMSPANLLCAIAQSCIGVREVGGDNRGPLVELFQSVVAKPVGQSWCLDFLQACIAYVETVKRVQSPLAATELCLAFWDQGRAKSSPASPARGDIVVWRLGDTIHGHVGLIVTLDTLRYGTIEGNTSNASAIVREGDGVYSKFRARGGSKSFVEMGVLRPFAAS